MGIFRKRKQPKGEHIAVEGVSGTASRAIYQTGYGRLPRIQFTIQTDTEDTVEIMMEVEEASKFIQSSLHALDAAIPDMPRTAYRNPFG